MCGRFLLTTPAAELARLFGCLDLGPLAPRYNIAPGQPVATVLVADGHGGLEPAGRRCLVLARWGLVPAWADEPRSRQPLINARSETVADKPAFRDAFRHRRCVIPADGFYEWQDTGHGKQPHVFLDRERRPLALAGVWERWYRPQEAVAAEPGPGLISLALITRPANATMAPIHDRMPALLESGDIGRWLDPATPRAAALALLRPVPEGRLEHRPVSERLNNPGHDDPHCLDGPLQPGFDFSAAAGRRT
jgi:putative SOS response-associated peptidase YedK